MKEWVNINRGTAFLHPKNEREKNTQPQNEKSTKKSNKKSFPYLPLEARQSGGVVSKVFSFGYQSCILLCFLRSQATQLMCEPQASGINTQSLASAGRVLLAPKAPPAR